MNIPRKTGCTTWILEAAVRNPHCILVYSCTPQAKIIEKEYIRLLHSAPWLSKLKWKLFGRKYPKFVSMDFNFSACNGVPVIFDNSVFRELERREFKAVK